MELIGNIVFANETEEFTTKYEPVQGCWSINQRGEQRLLHPSNHRINTRARGRYGAIFPYCRGWLRVGSQLTVASEYHADDHADYQCCQQCCQ